MKNPLLKTLTLAALGLMAVLLLSLLTGGGSHVANALRLDAPSLAPLPNQVTDLPFVYTEIDSTMAGDIKLVGDINGDSFPDLVVGGMPSERLAWYRYPTWQKTIIATPNTEFTTDGELGDVDGDGDLDIVVPDGSSGNNLVWFENPRPGGDPGTGNWTRRTIGSIGSWGKDVELADFDGDGHLDVATRQASSVMIFFQTAPNTWSQMTFGSLNIGLEGMTSGDVDSDGDTDLVLRGTWVRNPGGTAARTAANWTEFTIGTADVEFKALVVDLDKDGHPDVLFSSSENTAAVDWWSPTTGDPTGSWTRHTVIPSLNRAHTLQAADMDRDGDIDLVVAQMHTGDGQIMVLFNTDGQATAWQTQVVATGGIHNGVVADIGLDGDYDIFGANWTGNPPVKLWENQLNPRLPLDQWTYKQITSSHEQTFGLAFGDVNRDGLADIVSGRAWYRNPGGDLLGTWTPSSFPAGMHANLFVDIDGDNRSDVIAQKDEGDIALYWLEATNAGGTAWTQTLIGTVPRASHPLGAQGYRAAQIEAGGRPEIVTASGDGIYYFRVPANPAGGNWPRVHVNAAPSDEGLAVGDIDRDGKLDIAATTGDSKGVVWYKNPGNGSANWTGYQIATFSDATYPDRTELADLNRDGKLDILVTDETGSGSGAETYWWSQPANPTSGSWPAHLIVSQGTTNSMDVADMDFDGDTDVVLAEHRGSLKLAVWANNGSGIFTENLVSTGRESHLGARTIDLDNDSDLDIVSIAWDASNLVHLWRNDAINRSGAPTPTPTPGPSPTPSRTPTASATPCCGGRVTAGLQVLYTFAEGSGSIVHDVSGVGTPLNLTIGNPAGVTWLPVNGLTINSANIIQSAGAASKVINASQASNEITLEGWVRPADTIQNGPARILTLSVDPFFRNFTLGQEGSIYDVRLRTTTTTDNGIPSVATNSGAANTNLTHVVYTRDSAGAVHIYLNGTPVVNDNRDGNLSNWDSSYRLALVNELTQDRAWLGTLHLVAIYGRALTAAEVLQNYQAGSQVTPTPTPTNTPPPGASLTPTNTPPPGASLTPTNTPPPGASLTPTNTPPPGASSTPTYTPSPTSTPGSKPVYRIFIPILLLYSAGYTPAGLP